MRAAKSSLLVTVLGSLSSIRACLAEADNDGIRPLRFVALVPKSTVGRESADAVFVPKLEVPLWLEKLSLKVLGLAAGLELADNPNVSLERVASLGATIHLVVDLPDSLARIGTGAERKEDFMLFGDILLEAYPQMLASGQAGYGMDMSEIFGLFIFGDVADALHGEGSATRFGFQTIRTKAWTFSQWLQDARWLAAKSEITISWRTIDGIIANLGAANVI